MDGLPPEQMSAEMSAEMSGLFASRGGIVGALRPPSFFLEPLLNCGHCRSDRAFWVYSVYWVYSPHPIVD